MKANATMARPNTAAAPRIRPGDFREAGGGVGGVWGAFLDFFNRARSILLRRALDATATVSRKAGRRVDCQDVRQEPGLSGLGGRLRHLGNDVCGDPRLPRDHSAISHEWFCVKGGPRPL